MEKAKSFFTILGLGITIGVVVVVLLIFVIRATPKSVTVGGVEFEIPTSTPSDSPIQVQQAPQTPAMIQDPNLLHNEPISPETLAKIVGGDASYWTQRGPVVWGYSNKDHKTVFHHPGDNMILTYWAGFGDPQNADDCQIIVPQNDNLTKYVKCPSGTKAEIVADQVGLHLIDYTSYFP